MVLTALPHEFAWYGFISTVFTGSWEFGVAFSAMIWLVYTWVYMHQFDAADLQIVIHTVIPATLLPGASLGYILHRMFWRDGTLVAPPVDISRSGSLTLVNLFVWFMIYGGYLLVDITNDFDTTFTDGEKLGLGLTLLIVFGIATLAVLFWYMPKTEEGKTNTRFFFAMALLTPVAPALYDSIVLVPGARPWQGIAAIAGHIVIFVVVWLLLRIWLYRRSNKPFGNYNEAKGQRRAIRWFLFVTGTVGLLIYIAGFIADEVTNADCPPLTPPVACATAEGVRTVFFVVAATCIALALFIIVFRR